MTFFSFFFGKIGLLAKTFLTFNQKKINDLKIRSYCSLKLGVWVIKSVKCKKNRRIIDSNCLAKNREKYFTVYPVLSKFKSNAVFALEESNDNNKEKIE